MPTEVMQYKSRVTYTLFPTKELARADEIQYLDPELQILNRKIDSGEPWVPEAGELIYVQTSISIDHGQDDVRGGLAFVRRVAPAKVNGGTYQVDVDEHPRKHYYWDNLYRQQKALRAEWGKEFAREDPDIV